MKNILNEKPSYNLKGRLLASVKFVDDTDIINKEILDIGCGYGWCELNFLQRGVKKISAMEISEESLKTIRENVTDERVSFVVGSAIELSFKDGSFDTVVSWEVIEHIPRNKESNMFQEAKRVLKNDGIFYLSTPNKSFFSDICDPAWWLIGHRHYKKDTLIKYAENNGFKFEKIILRGGLWETLGINNFYIAKWIFKRRPFFESFFNKKQDEEYKKDTGFVNIFIKFRKVV